MAIAAERATAGGELSDRVRTIKNLLVTEGANFDRTRLEFLFEIEKDMGGEPQVTKYARLFERMCDEMEIFIDENPIVGTMTKYRAGVQFFPEITCKYVKKEKHFYMHLGEVHYDEDDRRVLDQTVDYWANRCAFSRAQRVWDEMHKDGPTVAQLSKSGVFQHVNAIPQGSFNPDFQKALTKGFKGIIAEVEEELAKLHIWSREDNQKRYFYKAVLTCLNALVRFAKRYASLAREMAEKEEEPQRRQELERIAYTCEWVPENPPRNFYEALQMIWFVECGCYIEIGPVSITYSRMNRYLNPFYKKDKEEGRISEEEAIELLQFLFLKSLASGIFTAEKQFRSNQGQTGIVITLGGQTADGEDATNEIDWLLLEVQKRLKVIQPTLSLYYHDKMSEEFLLKALELVRDTGLGQPAFFNNEIAVQRHLAQWGVPVEEARFCSHAGCVQTVHGSATAGVWEGQFHMAKMVEIVLNNGRDPISGFQIGLRTGEAEDFKSYEEFCDALRKQFQYFIKLMREFDELSMGFQAEILPQPFGSAFIDDCIKEGKDIWAGGARYNVLGGQAVTGIDLANSLAAIKKLVFEGKRISMRQLKAAVDANFEGDGHAEIQKMCLAAPKFGNDDPYVDDIAKEWYKAYYEEQAKVPTYLGRRPVAQAWSVTAHVNSGSMCGATPDGRKAFMPFTDATVSATPGTDKHGPTALVKSAVRAVDTVAYNSNHFNMKFHPSTLEGTDNLRKLLALIKTYMDLGGSHVQFNCISRDTLINAQLHPEEYRDLVVRVAGFSAFFVYLDKAVQDEIIKRTELRFDEEN